MSDAREELVSIISEYTPSIIDDSGQAEWTVGEAGELADAILKDYIPKTKVDGLVKALEYIAERDYISALGTVDSLQRWHREFNDVAKKALESFKEVSDE